MEKNATTLLKRGAEILSTPSAKFPHSWTKGTLARDHRNRTVFTGSPNACRFCGIGAIRRAGHELKIGKGVQDAAIRRLGTVLGTLNVADVNDLPGTTVRKMVTAFRKAAYGKSRPPLAAGQRWKARDGKVITLVPDPDASSSLKDHKLRWYYKNGGTAENDYTVFGPGERSDQDLMEYIDG